MTRQIHAETEDPECQNESERGRAGHNAKGNVFVTYFGFQMNSVVSCLILHFTNFAIFYRHNLSRTV